MAAAEAPAPSSSLRLRARADELERGFILEALQRTGGRKREVSLLLGIDPRNLS